MAKGLQVGDYVTVMDRGLLALQRFAPPGALPNNIGKVSELLEDDELIIEFPIGGDLTYAHSQVAPYPRSACIKRNPLDGEN
jgi:hypothetical protein